MSNQADAEARAAWLAERPARPDADYHEPTPADWPFRQVATGPHPWAEEQRQCEWCDEWHERLCPHSRDLCGECLHRCRDCMDEMAESETYDADREEGLV